MRYAIYFTPDRSNPLTRAAASWLGRDPFTNAPVPPPSVAGMTSAEISYHAASARRYGFHATLKAPFRLAEGEDEESLDAALAAFARSTPPVVLPGLRIGQIDGFFALLPMARVDALNALADDVVRVFEPFRAPLTEAEIERRSPNALTASQFQHLCRWGYPYVFDAFRFHMTLTGRASGDEAARIRTALEEVFSPHLSGPVAIDGLALFVEPEPGAPFTVLSRHALVAERARQTA